MSRTGAILCLLCATAAGASARVDASRFILFDLTASPALADVEVPKAARVSGKAADRVNTTRDGVSAPRVLARREPKYTEEARKAKIEGKVVLELVVTAKGAPEEVRVVKGLGAGLDESAVESVRQWAFQPATRYGKPIRSRMRLEVGFKLLN